MTTRRAKPFQRDPADLPRVLDEAKPDQVPAGPDLRISELLVREWKPAQPDLRSLHLDSCVLESAVLSQSVIPSARWKDVRFSQCDLANVRIGALTAVRIELAGCRMTGLQVEQADCRDVLFSGGDQRYTQFRFSAFKAAEFDGCDLEDADFYGADLRGCVFRRCNLRNVEMSKAKLEGADFRGSTIEGLRVGRDDIAGAIVDAAQALTLAPLLGIRIL